MRIQRRLIAPAFLIFTLVACSSEEQSEKRRLGGLGESCQARNDCAPDLACLHGACQLRGLDLKPTGKECYVIECRSKDDCCADFFLPPQEYCEWLHSFCQDGDAAACKEYEQNCVCRLECVEDRCVLPDTPCEEDDQCGQGRVCRDGRCAKTCAHDAQCGLLEACIDGTCAQTGCSSDRQCVYLLEHPRAYCDQGSCRVRCTENLDCNMWALEICHGGRCVFAGCTNDAECRAALGAYREVECR